MTCPPLDSQSNEVSRDPASKQRGVVGLLQHVTVPEGEVDEQESVHRDDQQVEATPLWHALEIIVS